MKCNRCGKEIDELEIFCSVCKKHLKEFTSKKQVNELEELIENQKNFDDLENTKASVDFEFPPPFAAALPHGFVKDTVESTFPPV